MLASLLITEASLEVILKLLLKTHPCIVAYQLLALVAGVGKKAVVAGDAVWILLRLDVLPSIQRFFAVVAIKALTHVFRLNVSLYKTNTQIKRDE